ncbi:beta 1-4 rhamnosyltransferase Cps2T [Enterococcus casseliflavus]|uniref:beta 1-4 rhamnosyltransferase Cps2T n=1 Tax=Enterococcus casseliflavus TaxID=37734 RepID=UPI0028912735|nr:DUF1972 domain-containing protein [Enterococcus casseliflavus]MDT2988008.1 DUF1972 domain-containing protein [Enterococcus casseliflavus]
MNRSVYIIGSKGIPAKYGGFETFVEKLTEFRKSNNIQYFVACMKTNSEKSNISQEFFEYNGAKCFNISVPEVGPAKAVIYDILSLKKAIEISKINQDKKPIFYVLACRIGPFINYFKKEISRLGGKLYVNPDGHEWKRQKWSKPVQKYWKFSERLMVKYSDLLICDSKTIEKYILKDYKKYTPKTKYIAYGTDIKKSKYTENSIDVKEWMSKKKIIEDNYYLVVGRFVPENNYESMIMEFMKSNSKKDFVLVTNIEKNSFYNNLIKSTGFQNDKRIKFVGTVYNQELLKYIRENAFAYIHGHEVGGTNPSLLEAMASTKLNLLLDVAFNREVAENEAIYWEKNSLHQVINCIEENLLENKSNLNKDTLSIIMSFFTWEVIINKYEALFTGAEL